VGSLSKGGAEVVQSGLIPIKYDPETMTARIDRAGPVLVFDTLDLGFLIDGGTESAVVPGPSFDNENRGKSGEPQVASALTGSLTQKNGSASRAAAQGASPEPTEQPRNGTPQEDTPLSDPAGAPSEPRKQLQMAFGEDCVLEGIRPDDRRIPVGLGFDAIPGGEGDAELLAVKCGPHPAGLRVAAVFNSAVAAHTFRVRNPALCRVGTVCGSRLVFWFSLQGKAPRNLFARRLSWVAEGIIPVSLAGQTAVTSARPGERLPVTRFTEIQWEDEVRRGFEVDEILQYHGHLFLPVGPKLFNVDLGCLCDLLLTRFDLVYDRIQESFRRFDAGTLTWATLSRREVVRLVAERLIRLAHDFPTQFPHSEVSKSKVQHLVWLMEIQGAVDVPTPQQVVQQFFSEAVEACVGAQLIQEAFYEGLVKYCKLRKLSLCSRAFFDRAATKRFGNTTHGTLRGRVGWRLKPEVISSPPTKHQSPSPQPDGQTPAAHA
jgi:hypothetical protein